MDTIQSIAEQIKKDMQSRWKPSLQPTLTAVTGGNPSFTPGIAVKPTNPGNPGNMVGKVKMWVNFCVEYDFGTNSVEIIKGPWTKMAGDSESKKKVVVPKLAKEFVADEVMEI